MNMARKMACLVISALFVSGTVSAQSTGMGPATERTIFGSAESFKDPVPLPRSVLELLIEPFKDDSHYRNFVTGKSDTELNQLFSAVAVHLTGLNQVEYVIGGNLPFAGADNEWFWVVRTDGPHPKVVLNEGASFLQLLNSRTNGFRDIQSVWVMSGTKRSRVFHYDGVSYTLFNETEKQKP
jgi:hypothetical protein